MELVADVRIELVEVRAAGGLLERDVVGDDRHLGRVVRADEGVQIGVVGGWIAGDERRLTVARREHAGRRRESEEEGTAKGGDA